MPAGDAQGPGATVSTKPRRAVGALSSPQVGEPRACLAYLDLGAEECVDEADPDVGVQVDAVPAEHGVLLHTDEDVQVPGLAALEPRIALALDAKLLPVVHTWQQGHQSINVKPTEPQMLSHKLLHPPIYRKRVVHRGPWDELSSAYLRGCRP